MNARVQNLLDGEHVPYEILAHPLAFTAQGVAHASHVSGWQMAKVVVVRPASGRPMMAVLPASCRLDLKHFEEVSGTRGLALVSETEMHDVFPDCETGAMPPFGNLYGLSVYVDAHLAKEPDVVFQAGNHREAVRVHWSDFERIVHPNVVDICKH